MHHHVKKIYCERLLFHLTGVFNSEISNDDKDGKKGVGDLIYKSNKGEVEEKLSKYSDKSRVLVIGSFPGEKIIKKAYEMSIPIPIVDFEILQRGLREVSARDCFDKYKLTKENALSRCFQSGEEVVDIESDRFNFFYQPNVVSMEEEGAIIEYLKHLEVNGKPVFDKNGSRQSIGFGAPGIKYTADNVKEFPARDWGSFSALKSVVDRINNLFGVKYDYCVIQSHGGATGKKSRFNAPVAQLKLMRACIFCATGRYRCPNARGTFIH